MLKSLQRSGDFCLEEFWAAWWTAVLRRPSRHTTHFPGSRTRPDLLLTIKGHGDAMLHEERCFTSHLPLHAAGHPLAGHAVRSPFAPTYNPPSIILGTACMTAASHSSGNTLSCCQPHTPHKPLQDSMEFWSPAALCRPRQHKGHMLTRSPSCCRAPWAACLTAPSCSQTSAGRATIGLMGTTCTALSMPTSCWRASGGQLRSATPCRASCCCTAWAAGQGADSAATF